MRLTFAMAAEPQKSELYLFKTFVDRMMAIQQQLHKDYQSNRQLRDQLLLAVDIPSIQETLNDRRPRTAHQLIERTATRLSHQPRTAGTSVAHLVAEWSKGDPPETQALYTLGQKYGGDAKRNVKTFGARSQRRFRPKHHKRQQTRWMRGIKG